MSESSDRENHDPLAFVRDDTKSEEPIPYVCSKDESAQSEHLVEGIIESRIVVHKGGAVGPENFREKLWPATLGFVELGLQGLLHNFVHGFNLAIGLRMGWGGEAKTDFEAGHQCRVRAISILGELPYEPVSVRPSDCRRCLYEFPEGHKYLPLESDTGGWGHPYGAVINGADEWGLCAGLVQELDVDVATYALLQG
ncbi:hypothetical protein L3X38_022421 [Prunus dulcis]|uniref:Uncharacterized protein n=1 Tax=Prunus dulcis TaxID=3755 RepID=A0AAD4VXW7_PRUDU|nr:hypothetical protein L3X38_022421 [Prunus dulcis]